MNKKLLEAVNGKKITVMGLGILGRGILVCKTLLKYGAQLHITDLKSKEELSESLKRLGSEYVYTTRFSEHVVEDFETCDLVIKSAGVPLDSPYIQAAQSKKIPVMMDASFAYSCFEEGVCIIGVTGTKGKSTVTHWIYESLKKVVSQEHAVYIGGNVRGGATLPLVDMVGVGDYVVLELDSWQLQGFGDMKVSPHISVFTNFMPDHMNYYKGSMYQYGMDKANIFLYQTGNDICILSQETVDSLKQYSLPLPKKYIQTSLNHVHHLPLKLLGVHNKKNAALVFEVLKSIGIHEHSIEKVLCEFGGVEGRLQYVKQLHGVDIYNDNNSTIPQSTIVSIESLKDMYNDIVLVCGGNMKGGNYESFVEDVCRYAKKVLILPGDMRILFDKRPNIEFVDTMQEAVDRSLLFCQNTGCMVFSPGGNSLASFKNEYDRNDQFITCIHDVV